MPAAGVSVGVAVISSVAFTVVGLAVTFLVAVGVGVAVFSWVSEEIE